MSNFLRASCSGAKNFFPLPNAIFSLRLSHVLRRQEVASVLAKLQNYWQGGGHEREHGAEICAGVGVQNAYPDGADKV